MSNNALNIEKVISILTKEQLIKDMHIENFNSEFKYISYNSQDVKHDTLFICKGAAFKEIYLIDAINKGSICYVSEVDYDVIDTCSKIIVHDIRKTMSILASAFYNNPSESLNITGITGTKGKTTTSFYLKSILNRFTGYNTALLSTVETDDGKQKQEAKLTTPESLDLHKTLYNIKNNNVQYLTMEVSSQAYKHSRVHGINFDVGIFTNIDNDHIGEDEHVDFEDYLSCKLQLMKNCKVAIIDSRTNEFNLIHEIALRHAEKIVVVGSNTDEYYISNISKQDRGFTFKLDKNNGKSEEYYISNEGRFNIDNALYAITAAKEYGVPYEIIKESIADINIKGRMNIFYRKNVKIIVDYAHNKLSFQSLFSSLKQDYPNSKIITVFGCAGNKNELRRKDLGTLCGKYSNINILTAEDPQFESVTKICEEIGKYIEKYKKPYQIIENRKKAIDRALTLACDDDIVIIAGKGDEKYQKINGEYIQSESDLHIVKKLLNIF